MNQLSKTEKKILLLLQKVREKTGGYANMDKTIFCYSVNDIDEVDFRIGIDKESTFYAKTIKECINYLEEYLKKLKSKQ